jgi:hypothetical protein
VPSTEGFAAVQFDPQSPVTGPKTPGNLS